MAIKKINWYSRVQTTPSNVKLKRIVNFIMNVILCLKKNTISHLFGTHVIFLNRLPEILFKISFRIFLVTSRCRFSLLFALGWAINLHCKSWKREMGKKPDKHQRSKHDPEHLLFYVNWLCMNYIIAMLLLGSSAITHNHLLYFSKFCAESAPKITNIQQRPLPGFSTIALC